MKISKLVKYIFGRLWIPLLFVILSAILFVISVDFNLSILQGISLALIVLSSLWLFISMLYHLLKRRWIRYLAMGMTLIFGFVAFVLYVFHYVFNQNFQPDTFADNLIIPKGIKLHKPIGSGFENSRSDTIPTVAHADFVLYKSFQAGLYEYDLWLNKVDKGTVYIRAFEITNNTPLSTNRLPNSTRIPVHNTGAKIKKFATTTDFTIYEGDWGKPYAARFEVWFKPDNGGKEEKLMEKNYIIEGWQH